MRRPTARITVIYYSATAHVPLATLDDLRWADGFALGPPNRFGVSEVESRAGRDPAGRHQGARLARTAAALVAARAGH